MQMASFLFFFAALLVSVATAINIPGTYYYVGGQDSVGFENGRINAPTGMVVGASVTFTPSGSGLLINSFSFYSNNSTSGSNFAKLTCDATLTCTTPPLRK